ncbi:MAG: DUF1302 domain-containing protein [bacterium]|nr:DUF1302 domain-containing protein [bacterium]
MTKHTCLLATLAAIALLAIGPASAKDFQKGDLSGSWDTTISWGAQYRLDDPDLAIVGLPEGGTAFSVNGDSGNLNYDKGIVSNVLKLTTELELGYKNVGTFVRFRGFYDEENEDGDRERTPLSQPAKDRIGSRADLLDAFVWGKFDLGGRPAEIRLGEQVLSWGESTFIQGGINTINPVDVSAIRVPGAELREALTPEGMVTFSVGTSENTSLELLWLYDWGRTKIDPPGSYWSTSDFAGNGGGHVFLGFGDSPDDFTFPFSDRPFLGVPRAPSVFADDSGQYGAAFRVFAPNLNGTEFGFYYLNFHSRLPTINGTTGTLAGALAGSGMANAGTAALTALTGGAGRDQAIATGAQVGILAGLSATEAFVVSTAAVDTALAGGNPAATITAFATDAYAQTANYFLAYPEDIKLVGISFNTAIGSYAVQGELSQRQDAPLQVDDVELLFSALGPFNSGLAQFNQVGNFTGQFETFVPGIRRLDVNQFQMTITKILGRVMGADQGVLLWEGAITQVPDLPSKDELRFEGPGTYVSGNAILGPSSHAGKPIEDPSHFADDSSWGYRLVSRLDYNNAFGGWNVSPRFSWQHDVEGVSPGPGGNFIEDRTALTLGLGFNRQSTWQFDLSYTVFSGASRYNLVNDRDFAGVNVKYSF